MHIHQRFKQFLEDPFDFLHNFKTIHFLVSDVLNVRYIS
jgi:hypothetical protein